MSPHQTLSVRTLDRLCEDVLENMKSSGLYDEIRIKLMNDLCDNGDSYDDIVESFKHECARFCSKANLASHRNVLRNELTQNIESHHTRYSSKLKSQVSKLLYEQKEDVKSKYYKHAGDYLRKKFLPQVVETNNDNNYPVDNNTEPKQNPDSVMEVDMDIESSQSASSLCSIPSMSNSPLQQQQQPPPPPPTQEESQQPSIPSISSEPATKKEQEPDNTSPYQQLPPLPLSSPPPLPPSSPPEVEKADAKVELEQEQPGRNASPVAIEEYDLSEIEAPTYSPIGDSQPESEPIEEQPPPLEADQFEMEELTLSSVSSISTADLSDFDEAIKLSDDEAVIVGKPKNSTARIEEVLPYVEGSSSNSKHVEQQQVSNIEETSSVNNNKASKQLRQQPQVKNDETNTTSTAATTSTDEASGSESGKRTRKSNPKYDTKHYQL